MKNLVIIYLFSIIFSLSFSNDKDENYDNKSIEKEAKEFGKNALNQARSIFEKYKTAEDFTDGWKTLSTEDMDKLNKDVLNKDWVVDSEGKKFIDSDEIKNNIKKNKDFSIYEFSFDSTKQSLSDNDFIKSKEKLIKCREAGSSYVFSLLKERSVEFEKIPGEVKENNKCLGHSRSFKAKNRNELLRLEAEFKRLEKPRNIRRKGKNNKSKYEYYEHPDNSTYCDNFQIEKIVITEESLNVKGEKWRFLDKDLETKSLSSSSILLRKQCLDYSSKILEDGKSYTKCWKKQYDYIYRPPQLNDCDFLKDFSTELINRKCIKTSKFGCEEWELTFKVNEKANDSKEQQVNYYGMNGEFKKKTKHNSAFSKILTKLFVLDAMKKDLESTQNDARKARIFTGKEMRCQTSIFDNILYDCCGDLKGFAIVLKLTKCNSEEKSLAQKRMEGLCHQCGKKKGFLNMEKKRVFCCFSSKLARILQEQARLQLNIGWGDFDHPNCDGLTIDQIKNLDFEKMDLSELYKEYENKISQDAIDKKLNNFQNNLKDALQSEEKEIFPSKKRSYSRY